MLAILSPSIASKFCASLFALTAALVMAAPASAQDVYPDKPVRLIVGRPPGGVADLAARVIGQHLQARWKQQVIVENRGGGNGVIAQKAILQAPEDGYTLLVAADSDFTINRFVSKNWQPSFDTDIVPIARLSFNPVVLVAHSKAPFNSVQDLIAAAKADPGGITFATAGIASSPHLVAEFFAQRTGTDLRHIPYRGGPGAAAAAAGGHTQLAALAISSSVALVQSGEIKVIGLTTKERLKSLPDWPTISESGVPDFEANIWTGIFAKAGTPTPLLKRIEADLREILSDPAVARQFEEVGAEAAPLFGEELRAEIKKDSQRNGDLVQRLKLAAD